MPSSADAQCSPYVSFKFKTQYSASNDLFGIHSIAPIIVFQNMHAPIFRRSHLDTKCQKAKDCLKANSSLFKTLTAQIKVLKGNIILSQCRLTLTVYTQMEPIH